MAINYFDGVRGNPGALVSITDVAGVTKRTVIPAMMISDSSGNEVAIGSSALTAGTDRSGTATTTSGGLTVAANSSRKALIGQNISAVSIGFSEFAGTAAIGTAGTYTVPAGSSFSISTNRAVNFVAASGTAAVTMTEY
jgi:hypothetical protein